MSSQKAMKNVRVLISMHERLLALLPPATIHATVGALYLSEDVAETLDGTVLETEQFSPMEGLIVYEPDKFSVLDLDGRTLFSSTPTDIALGVPENFDAMPLEEKYFFLLFGDDYALVAMDHRPLGEPTGSRLFVPSSGDRELAYWDHYVG